MLSCGLFPLGSQERDEELASSCRSPGPRSRVTCSTQGLHPIGQCYRGMGVTVGLPAVMISLGKRTWKLSCLNHFSAVGKHVPTLRYATRQRNNYMVVLSGCMHHEQATSLAQARKRVLAEAGLLPIARKFTAFVSEDPLEKSTLL